MKKISTIILFCFFFSNSFQLMGQVFKSSDEPCVVMELLTGTWCTNCLSTVYAIEELLEENPNLAILEHHIGDDFEIDLASFRKGFYDIQSISTAVFDGQGLISGGNLFPRYLAAYQEKMAKVSSFNIDLSAELKSNKLSFSSHVFQEKTYEGGTLRFYAILSESAIPCIWQGLTTVNFVTRQSIPGVKGAALEIENGGSAEYTYEVEIKDDWVADHMKLVVFVQDMDSREILAATQIDFSDAVVGIQDVQKHDLNNVRVYPNPSKDKFHIESQELITHLAVRDLMGNLILNQKCNSKNELLQLEELSQGVYFIQVQMGDQSFWRKLVLN